MSDLTWADYLIGGIGFAVLVALTAVARYVRDREEEL